MVRWRRSDGASLRNPAERRSTDLFVVPDTSPSHEAALWDAARAGSAAAGQELGLVLAARGDLGAAHGVWTEAAGRGSAEALYLATLAEYLRDEDLDAYLAGAARADAAGSLLGAFALAATDEHAVVGEGERWAKALARAAERDAAGSADGAVVLAQVHHARGAFEDAVSAWERAERRGAPSATVGLAAAFLGPGDVAAAEAAARRGEAAGAPAAGPILAGVLQQRKDWKESHRALLRTAERAGDLGDWTTVDVVRTLLDPLTRVRLRGNRGRLAAVLVTLWLVGMVAGWPWAAAVTATLLGGVLVVKPALRGMPVWIDGAGPESVSLLGLAVSGQLTYVAPGPRPSMRSRRPVTARDLVLWRLLVLVVGVVALSTWMWAAGWWTAEVLGRIALGGAAVVLVLAVVWRWLEDVPAALPAADATAQRGLDVLVSFSPLPFLTTHLRLAVTDPRFTVLVSEPRERAVETTARRSVLARTVEAVPEVTVAATLAALAVAPDQREAVDAVVTVVGAVLEVLVVLGGLGASVRRAYRGVRHRRPADLGIAVAYVTAVALIVGVAMWLDLDAGLVRTLTGMG